MHFRTKNGLARTNNFVEGWHQGLQSKLQFANKFPVEFIKELSKDFLDYEDLLLT